MKGASKQSATRKLIKDSSAQSGFVICHHAGYIDILIWKKICYYSTINIHISNKTVTPQRGSQQLIKEPIVRTCWFCFHEAVHKRKYLKKSMKQTAMVLVDTFLRYFLTIHSYRKCTVSNCRAPPARGTVLNVASMCKSMSVPFRATSFMIFTTPGKTKYNSFCSSFWTSNSPPYIQRWEGESSLVQRAVYLM